MYPKFSSRLLWFSLCCLTLSFVAKAQTPAPSPPDDVVRTDVELVQTDITVFDRHGKLVGSLQPEHFTLSVDGQKRPISLLSRITSGSQTEAEQLNALHAATKTAGTPRTLLSRPGRLIFFFVDDIHLSPDGIARMRKALAQFIEMQMGQDDQVAIVSTSGRIGFLQQLTDNRVVLQTAISRLGNARNVDEYVGKTKITEQMASQIQDGHNSTLFYYLMDSVKADFQMGMGVRRRGQGNSSAQQASRLLTNRVRAIAAQAKLDTTATLDGLRGLLQSSASLPGRKLVFFVSDGFIVDPRGSTALQTLKELSQMAARSGAVIYTMDARGTHINSEVDATRSQFVDMTSRQGGVAFGETVAPREPLSTLAYETGGRAIFNSNSIQDAIGQAVSETSEYYVLAWRPETENERLGKARIDVSIEGQPDLRARLRPTYFTPVTSRTSTKQEPAPSRPDSADAQLMVALGSVYPTRSLPTSVSVGYVKHAPAESTLRASMQIERSALNPYASEGKNEIDIIGAAVDDRGLIYTFKQLLTVTPPNGPSAAEPNIVWNQQLKVQPGLYQVRVAVRERRTGRTGSAMQWIDIPRPDQQRFSMSSLFLGERMQETKGPQPIRVDVDHRFQRSSVMRFQTYVYNASRAGGDPNVWIHAQVLRGNERVFSLAPNRIPPEVAKDPTQLPYWTEIRLDQLPVGRYTLQVSATDRATNNTATQTINFSVE